MAEITGLLVSGLLSLLLIAVGSGVAYLYLLAVGNLKPGSLYSNHAEPQPLAVAIPAHNEEPVIARTIASIRAANYPEELLDIYIVADHCTDQTAQAARLAGAVTFERQDGERGGKGQALTWLFQKIEATGKDYVGVVIFDADTLVHPRFFQIMNTRLTAGDPAIQGNHVIRNPQAGWFPALTWAMFLIDNRVQNQGRARLGLSAKNMGDSICFSADLLRRFGWGGGLTEDYAFRQRLLLEGVKIGYEPAAIGYGDAAATWQEAHAQRARWLRGAYQSSRETARQMLAAGWRRRDLGLLDGALQAYLPSYSTLTLLAGLFTLLAWILRGFVWGWLPAAWTVIFCLIFLYPFLGLALERAPLKAYLVILTGPIFIAWRTWIGFSARFLRREVRWVRTPRHIGPS